MVDPTSSQPRTDGSDDDIVATAFAAYRARAVEEFAAPPSSVIMARAGRQPRRRALTVSVAALACTGLMVAGVAVAQTVASGDNDEVVNADGESATEGGDSEENGEGGVTSGDSTSQPGEPDPVETELRALTISLPAWPGSHGERCPAGDYRFAPDDDSDDVPETPSGGPDGDWRLLPQDSRAKTGELADRDSVVVPVACGEVPGVVALTQSSDEFTSMGFVHAGRKAGGVVTVESVEDDSVVLAFGESPDADEVELREFDYDGDDFTEVEPPQDSPASDPGSPSEEPDPTPSDGDDDDSGKTPDPGESGGDSDDDPHERDTLGQR